MMDKKTRNLLIIGSIITFVIVPIVATLLLSRPPKTADNPPTAVGVTLHDRSNDELMTAIKTQSSDLAESSFIIATVTQPQKGWYVVTINLQDDPQYPTLSRLLLQDTSGGLSILLGPGTFFGDDTTQSIGVPTNVAKELNS